MNKFELLKINLLTQLNIARMHNDTKKIRVLENSLERVNHWLRIQRGEA